MVMECRVSWGRERRSWTPFISACLIWGDSAPREHGVMSGASVLVMGEGSGIEWVGSRRLPHTLTVQDTPTGDAVSRGH